MTTDDLTGEIQKLALQNALEHDGKTSEKIILAKILGQMPEMRGKIKEIMPEIASVVQKVNNSTKESQRSDAQRLFPELLEKSKKTHSPQKPLLAPLENAIDGKVVTRFPPEPNGYPHIGHAKAAIINEEYAKMYNGKLILRFDDTNPRAERLEYYAAIKVGLDWLNIKYNSVKNTSDDMELMYEKGKNMMELNRAYVCTCKQENIKNNRMNRIACKCSKKDQDLEDWDMMFTKIKPGKGIVRFRGDMNSDNTVMRDPVLFRIVDEKHPLVGDKYRVWPSYDFAVAIEDSADGITHAFRTKEYELRNELYYTILDILEMRKPIMSEFSRLEFDGMPVSKRILRPLIEDGKVSWYDDPRLPTLEALRRRGMRPEGIRKFIASLGLTKADTLAPFDALESFNRKHVDKTSIRLFMVTEPVLIKISGSPEKIEISNHPTGDMGKRTVEVGGQIYLAKEDLQNIAPGTQIRLIGLGNISINKISDHVTAEYVGDTKDSSVIKVQWVPKMNSHKIKVIIPKILFINDSFNEDSLEEKYAYTEPEFLNLEEGSEIQFVRFGYCRKDSQNQVIFTHK